ncbi:MAG: NAD(P)-binding protein [Lachnospiraceae bacterium]|nr:NAD(P)-binding protein [Lachnospiraceae bacterium]
MKVGILGAGLAGLSAALFLQESKEIQEIHIFEKEKETGGLCRSFIHDGRYVDIGPHIFFSKNKEVLDFMRELLGENQVKLRRSNQIIYKGKFVQYPFENDLSKLPEYDRQKCVDSFLNNPYKTYESQNMLQFFLKTFGEGITNLYLRPYNEKIWKFDPSYMNTTMVERIPQPPDEDILKSAAGETIDGYLHQLYFYYPQEGGTASLIKGIENRLKEKVIIHKENSVVDVEKKHNYWKITTNKIQCESDLLISCIPVNELIKVYHPAKSEIKNAGASLKFNHLILGVATVSVDRAGNNYAFMIPDKDIIFHRLSKLDFLGCNYGRMKTATYMMEVTYREESDFLKWNKDKLKSKFIEGLKKINFIENEDEVIEMTFHCFPYAYIIYDLEHSNNMKKIRSYFKQEEVVLNGRFGNFEYWNMDKVIEESKKISNEIITRLSKQDVNF